MDDNNVVKFPAIKKASGSLAQELTKELYILDAMVITMEARLRVVKELAEAIRNEIPNEED